MSNEYKEWVKDATDDEVLLGYQRCIDNGWYFNASYYKSELDKRGVTVDDNNI